MERRGSGVVGVLSVALKYPLLSLLCIVLAFALLVSAGLALVAKPG